MDYFIWIILYGLQIHIFKTFGLQIRMDGDYKSEWTGCEKIFLF